MTREDLDLFKEMLLKQQGPFTDYWTDIAILPKIMAWIGDD